MSLLMMKSDTMHLLKKTISIMMQLKNIGNF